MLQVLDADTVIVDEQLKKRLVSVGFQGNLLGIEKAKAEPIHKNVLKERIATVYKGNIIKNLIMDCQSYTKYRPNETTGGIFVSWRRKEELPTGA